MTEHEIQKRLQQKPVVLGLSALACLLWGVPSFSQNQL